ncbi:hypothetical protein LPB140_07990 [Sphingorhabdus lutea]|uniref:Phage holin family protein n=1 Tax=Sphingorhabdus lutea TaxID=1913578 RepID=A0A1L3JC62_9SPHN|nr:hypothetical protein [Sphingorhabdus lutea]APG62737.1 hypothetical protein LPB140_07990 [Sphingorhabdus lutea]
MTKHDVDAESLNSDDEDIARKFDAEDPSISAKDQLVGFINQIKQLISVEIDYYKSFARRGQKLALHALIYAFIGLIFLSMAIIAFVIGTLSYLAMWLGWPLATIFVMLLSCIGAAATLYASKAKVQKISMKDDF